MAEVVANEISPGGGAEGMTDEKREEAVEALIKLAKSTEALEVLAYGEGEEGLKGSVEEAFGSWEMGLAAALREAAPGWRAKPRRPQPSVVERRITEAFEHPIYVETQDGRFYSMHGPDLGVNTEGVILDEEMVVRAIHYLGSADTVGLFSSEGRYFGLDQRMIPLWDRREERRSIRDILFLQGDEGIGAAVARRAMATGRVIHVTAEGKGKATEAGEFGSGLDRSGMEAFLVKDEDRLVTVLAGPTENTVFCASALGQGIHFEAEELRSMGRKAVGVNLMKLNGEEDAIVAAFLGRNVRQIAVVTEEGYGKRVDFSEFRTQGRAGQGMQLLRLNAGDRVAGAVACNPGEDLAMVTNRGRVYRIPTAELMLMGRPAKGNPVVDLEEGERIGHLCALPCGG